MTPQTLTPEAREFVRLVVLLLDRQRSFRAAVAAPGRDATEVRRLVPQCRELEARVDAEARRLLRTEGGVP
jgi:hypothetical protein